MRRLRKPMVLTASVVGLVLALRFAPASARPPPQHFELIAHRGVHQTFDAHDVGRNGCTAAHIVPPSHHFIENTIPSIAAAFDAGATLVELDFHETLDNQIIVFHDWTLECRTNGAGVTHEQTLAYLKSLDVGWGYTADHGRTFPLRGEGVGMMPTLREVLDRFPEGSFILDNKGGHRHSLEVLASVLSSYSAERRSRLHYWGERPDWARELIPGLGASFHGRSALKRCAVDYLFSLGLGALPVSCQGAGIIVPSWAPAFAWGWPDRFLEKASAAGSQVIVWTDDAANTARADGVMTDKIEIVGPALEALSAVTFRTCPTERWAPPGRYGMQATK